MLRCERDRFVAGVREGDRRAVAKAITLLESTRPEHAGLGQAVLEALVPRTGTALRVGITGPPGVGKNEFAYALAEILYGDERAVVGIDMRAITTEEDVSRLSDTIITGPTPVLLEGIMTTPIRRRPHSILLLKGIEHAHPVAHRLLQQIISQGWLEDARGRVSFEETIIFATSRIPEDEEGPTTQIGFTQEPKSCSLNWG